MPKSWLLSIIHSERWNRGIQLWTSAQNQNLLTSYDTWLQTRLDFATLLSIIKQKEYLLAVLRIDKNPRFCILKRAINQENLWWLC